MPNVKKDLTGRKITHWLLLWTIESAQTELDPSPGYLTTWVTLAKSLHIAQHHLSLHAKW